MNLYLLTREGSTAYDEYSGAVVVAEDPAHAVLIHPAASKKYNLQWKVSGRFESYNEKAWAEETSYGGTWVSPSAVHATFIGEAAPGTVKGVILASFHAG